MRRRLTLLFLLTALMCILLTGCGKDGAIEKYKEDLNTFCENISAQSDAMDAIDPQSETATEDFLSSLDALEKEFTALAEMEVPKQFSSVESLADEAGEYMTEAVKLYHDAFSAEPYDEDVWAAATESYQRAIKRVQYIGDILMGNIPEGDDIEVQYSDDTNESDGKGNVSNESGTVEGAPGETGSGE